MKEKRWKGIISINSKGVGFFIIPNEDKKLEETLEIQTENLARAFHGDTVEIEKTGQSLRDREQGKVIKTISRLRDEFVGTIQKNSEIVYVVPDDKRMYIDILLKSESVKGVLENNKVLVKIVEWKETDKNPVGKILKVIGTVGENNTEMESIVLEKGFRVEFPPEVEAEAEKKK